MLSRFYLDGFSRIFLSYARSLLFLAAVRNLLSLYTFSLAFLEIFGHFIVKVGLHFFVVWLGC